MRAFWPYIGHIEFSLILGLHRKTEELQYLSFQVTSSKKLWQNFMKSKKNLHFSPFCRFQGILGDFRELRKQEFFWRISFYHFSVFRFLLLCRVSEKLRKKLQDKLVKEVQSEGYKNKQEFTGPPLPAKRIQRQARIHWTSTASKKEWFMQKSDEHKLRRSLLLFVVQLP